MTSLRAKSSAVVLITSVLAMLSAPLLAASPHEACEAMRHGCAKIEASCCCGDRSEANPSQTPAGRSDLAGSPPAVAVIAAAFEMPAVTIVFAGDGLPPLAHPPNLHILFRDLRL